jgi:urease accessory protein
MMTTTITTTITETTRMPDTSLGPMENSALIRLMAWLSPSFPTGAFAYSCGLEAAFLEGRVKSVEDLEPWLKDLLAHGWIWNDAVLCRAAAVAQAAGEPLDEIQEIAEASAGSAERYAETLAVGASFRAAAVSWPGAVTPLLPDRCALPVAVGRVSAGLGIPAHAMLAAFLQATVTNQIQAAQRLAPIGQARGVALLAALEPAVLAAADRAVEATTDDLCSATIAGEIMAMQHATLKSRIFKS